MGSESSYLTRGVLAAGNLKTLMINHLGKTTHEVDACCLVSRRPDSQLVDLPRRRRRALHLLHDAGRLRLDVCAYHVRVSFPGSLAMTTVQLVYLATVNSELFTIRIGGFVF